MKDLRFALFVMVLASCSTLNTLKDVNWGEVTGGLSDIIRGAEGISAHFSPGNRGQESILQDYNIGDVLSAKDKKEVLELFSEIGAADKKCGIYVCDNGGVYEPCVIKDSACDCLCYTKETL